MEGIQVKIIGCGDAFSSGGRLNTSFLVKSQTDNFLIDCGTGILAGLNRYSINTNEISTILITHFHGDHYGGLPFFLLEAASYGREEPLTIISPPGCKERVSQLLKLLYPGSKIMEKLALRFLTYSANKIMETEGLSLMALPVLHTPETLPHGLRINIADKVISYSGDTEWTPALERLADQANLFICECNFYRTEAKGHLNYQHLIANSNKLHCRQILLTHLGREMFSNQEQVQLPCADDGLEINI